MVSTSVHSVTLPADHEHVHVELLWDTLLENRNDWKVLSWVRCKPTWIEPKVYHTLDAHPELASSLILLKSWNAPKSGREWTLAIYPVSTLQANHNLIVRDGKVLSNVRRVGDGNGTVWVVCAEAYGRDERGIVRIVVEKAKELVGGRPRVGKRSAFWDGLGVCTWESFGGSHRKPDRPTLELLLSLVPSVPVRQFLIDDGWQDIHPSRRLRSFHEWDGMQAPMGEVADALKARGIEHVGVWVTLNGYWMGIDPQGELAERYACKEYAVGERGLRGLGGRGPGAESMWLPAADKAGEFWRDWFRQMKEWGISFVKVDNQAIYDGPVGPGAARAHQAMWSGMLDAAEAVFGTTDSIIMCMSHNERMLNGPGGLDFDRPGGDLVFRNSDDFNLQFETAHQSFVHWNLHQSILTSHLSFTPDYDMFMSSSLATLPAYHALLRALAPGPLLLSDTPQNGIDQSLIARLVGTTHDGQQRAVKAREAAQVLRNRWFWDNIQGGEDGPALIGSTPVPEAHGALIGAWNTRDGTGHAVDGIKIVDLEDALGVDKLEHDYFVVSVGAHTAGFDRPTLVERGVAGGASIIDIDLKPGTCEGYVLARAWNVGGRRIGVLGLKGMLAPLCGIESVQLVDGELVIKSEFRDQTIVVAVAQTEQQVLSLTFTTGGNRTVVPCAPAAGKRDQQVCLAEIESARVFALCEKRL
ncbi:hypothetical protein Q5752_006949 [Cryptotrichosporon argae]